MRRHDLVGEGDVTAQARFVFKKIGLSLAAVGAQLSDVVRTRLYITNVEHADAVIAVHAEAMQAALPAATLVVVKALIDPRLLVEIEVDAIVTEESGV